MQEEFMNHRLMMLSVTAVVLSSCTLFGIDQAADTLDRANETATKVGETVEKTTQQMEQADGGPFEGTLEAAMALGVPMKCTWDYEGDTGTTYVQGKKMYVETTTDGQEFKMIVNDKCMWTWGSAEAEQGVTMCFEEDVMDREEYDDYTVTAEDTNYNCLPTVISGSQFTPPSDVEFVDLQAMMKSSTEDLQKLMEEDIEE